MTKDEAIAALKALEGDLRRRGVAALHLYGSVARNAADVDSDVDLYFDSVPGARIGLDLVGMKLDIEEALGVEVDFGTRDGLHPLARAEIEAQSVKVF